VAIVTGTNSTSPNTIKWASTDPDIYDRATQMAGPIENFDVHDHDAAKGLGVKRLQTAVAPTAAGHVRINADALQWWGSSAGAIRTAVDGESTQSMNGVKTWNGAATFAGGATVAGTLVLSTAVSKIRPGATSFAIRNNADAADNVLVTDAGAATIRAGLTVTAGGLAVLAGNLGVGTSPAADRAIAVSGSGLTGTSQYGVVSIPTVSSGATVVGAALYAQMATTPAAFTLATAYGLYVEAASKGAGSTITTTYGIYVKTQTSSANGFNYNLYVEAGSGGNDYSLYVAGKTQYAGTVNFASGVTFAGSVGFYGHVVAGQPTISGSRGGNAALASLLTSLAGLGLIVDGTSA
jgi:hypothetical protein